MTKFNGKHIIYAALLVLLFVPILQESFGFVKERDLNGSFTEKEKSDFSRDGWFSGDFQTAFDAYLENNFGFRKSLVRVYNQIQYSLFQSSTQSTVEVGKDEYLFSKQHLRSYFGMDFMGPELIETKMTKLAAVSDTLKSLGVDFLFVLGPSKASYFPEKISNSWNNNLESTTNYDILSKELPKRNIHFLDCKKWLFDSKDTATYHAFGKTSTHINRLTDLVIIDSLIDRIESIQNIHLNRYIIDDVVVSDSMRYIDDDIEKSMNLMFNIPDEKMPYPSYHVTSDSAATLPNIITVADSYFWEPFMMRLSKDVYNQSEFWYYLNEVYPRAEGEYTYMKDVNFKAEIINADMVVLWVAEINLYGLGFIEKAYDAFFAGEKTAQQKKWDYYYLEAQRNNEWFQGVRANAKSRGISIEEALENTSTYSVELESR